MSPPIHKDWWLAAALTSATIPAAMGQPVTGAGRTQSGVVTSVTQPGTRAVSTPLYIDGTRDQRLVTGPNETMHVLFADQSAITLGPNSEVKIAEFRYDSQTRDGNLLIQMTKGALRAVGGFLSKKRDTRIVTSTATIGVRGGITLVFHDDDRTDSTLLFGVMGVTSADGLENETVTSPGFEVSTKDNKVSSPRPITADGLTRQLAALEGTVTPPIPTGDGGDPKANQQVKSLGPNRLEAQKDVDAAVRPPTLADVLGGQAPGNQS